MVIIFNTNIHVNEFHTKTYNNVLKVLNTYKLYSFKKKIITYFRIKYLFFNWINIIQKSNLFGVNARGSINDCKGFIL